MQHVGAGSSLRSVLSYVSYSQTCGNAESEKYGCMHGWMHACVCVGIMCIYVHVCVCTCMYVCRCVYVYVCVCMYACIQVYVYVHGFVCILYLYVDVSACMYHERSKLQHLMLCSAMLTYRYRHLIFHMHRRS